MSQPPASVDRRRVKYEVPFTWLLGVGAFLAVQAATIYFGQQRQAELIQQLSASNVELVSQIKSLSAQIAGKDIKDVQHDMQLSDHERRLSRIEGTDGTKRTTR